MIRVRRDRSVALVMAVLIMAVLAVIGFSFAASMKIESAVTRSISNLAQARYASQAAIQLLGAAFKKDSLALPSATAGPVADHSGETLFSASTATTLMTLGNLTIEAEQTNLADESAKMDLNAYGNLALWYKAGYPNSKTSADITDASLSVYQGANDRFSSFEVSFEEFFYSLYQQGTLWKSTWPSALQTADVKEARIRSGNLARAICLYRYGPDCKPGRAAVDDDSDSAASIIDGIDNNADGVVDEANEGTDEPDEYNPFDPDGDGKVNDGTAATNTGPKDDRRFYAAAELQTALVATYLGGTVPSALAYAGDATAQTAEATRSYNAIKDQITVYASGMSVRAACIDDPATDGYDNDGDGFIDASDTSGATDIAGIKAQIDSGTNINNVNINESSIAKDAQAAYLYWKLTQSVTYTNTDGATVTQSLVKNFSVQNAVDAVDYRDTDCVPTMIAASALGSVPTADTYGFEGLHITELGRFILDGSSTLTADGSPWTGTGTCTLSVGGTPPSDPASDLTLTDATNLKQGAYLLKCTVAVPAGGKILFTATTGETREASQNGTFYFGPFNADSGGVGRVTVSVTTTSVQGTYSVSAAQVILPYIEIMNLSRRTWDISQMLITVGSSAQMSIGGGTIAGPAGGTWANGETIANTNIARLKKVTAGFDATNRHGPYPGFFIIVYNQTAFDNNFIGPGTRDFPISVMPTLFDGGFDGTQAVTLKTSGGQVVAGGAVDRLTAGTGAAFSATSIARVRTCPAGNLAYNAFVAETTSSGSTTPIARPGRWHTNNQANGSTYLWPQATTNFASDYVSVVTTADRGYFRSPAEILRLEVATKYLTTISLYGVDNDWTAAQPDITQLPGWVVTARAPARVNINTAGTAVMAAAFCNAVSPLPSSTTLASGRPYTVWGWNASGTRRSISSCFYDSPATGDDDSENDGNDYGEKLEWPIRFSNVFSIRSDVFSSSAAGYVKNANGQIVAQSLSTIILSRGKRVSSTGETIVDIIGRQ